MSTTLKKILNDGADISTSPTTIEFGPSFTVTEVIDGNGEKKVTVNFGTSGFSLTNTSTNNTISVDQNGNVGTDVSTDGAVHIENTGNTGIGLGVYTNIGATADAPLVEFKADNASFDQPILQLTNDSSAISLYVRHIGDLTTAAAKVVWIEHAGINSLNKTVFYVYNNKVNTGGFLAHFHHDHASSAAQNLVKFTEDGTPSSHIVLITATNTSFANAALGIVNSTGSAHLNLSGDGANASSADGDIWFDGTNLKMNIGGTVYNVDMTAA